MHADRYVEGNKTMEALFLGENAKFPAGPFILAARLRVPVSFVFSMKEGHSHYHFFASPGKQYTEPDRAMVQKQVLSDFVGEIEKKVKAYPAQWYNYYEFWK
jgi:predicted LPLAT superfamily acyltransferase